MCLSANHFPDCYHNTLSAECKRACGDCRDNITCNAIVGMLDVGCDPGVYVTLDKPMCNQECCNGMNGLGCAYKCGACADGTPCNKSSGLCPGECDPGFVGVMCTEKDGALAPVSVALLVIGILFLIAGLRILFAIWVYKKRVT
ncbi:scavenger receptor class F member 2-like [Mya arenaria]|uniref:scavenger receptor class F member 2-like n=1 Tax=Mya arenaria TaxID=6604 RepID=UPI0022DF164C|nr:scavenger receptor class F member 2-like [Mya arenaria]